MLIFGYIFLGMMIGGSYGWVIGIFGAIVGFFAGLASSKRNAKKEKALKSEIASLKESFRSLRALVTGETETPAPMQTQSEAPRQEPSQHVEISTVELDSVPPAPLIPQGLPIPPKPAASEGAPQPAPHPADFGLFRFFVDFFTKGNVVVRIGMLILFLGLTFLLKMAADSGFFPMPVRFLLVAAASIGLISWGWILRKKRPDVALVVEGGGIALFYLTVFTATLPRFGLVPPGLAFVFLVLVVTLSGLLAVGQNSIILAILATGGGFMAPILVSTGSNNYIGLFTYYAILNLGIVGMALYRSWRPLNLLGFFFTFGIGTLWGFKFYAPENFPTVEPFLILFFLFYVTVTILFATRQPKKHLGAVDGFLTFATPFTFILLQYGLVHAMDKGMAFSSLALTVFYLLLSYLLLRKPTLKLLAECFLILGVIFLTLTIPLGLNTRLTSASWAVEGAGLVFIGLRQNRKLARYFGIALLFLAGFVIEDLVRYFGGGEASRLLNPIANPAVLGGLILAFASAFAACVLRQSTASTDRFFSGLLYVWALGWWYAACGSEIHVRATTQREIPYLLLFISATQAGLEFARRKLSWNLLSYPGKIFIAAVWPLLFASMAASRSGGWHPSAHLGWLAWPVVVTTMLWILYRQEKNDLATRWAHPPTLCFIIFLLIMESIWQIHQLGGSRNPTWVVGYYLMLPSALGLTLLYFYPKDRWPLRSFLNEYLKWGLVPVVAFLYLWFWVAQKKLGRAEPLPFLPVLNPIDLPVLMTLLFWIARHRYLVKHGLTCGPKPITKFFNFVIGFHCLVAFTCMITRVFHHYFQIPYTWDGMYGSLLVQTTLSIAWTGLALTAMVMGTRRLSRPLWMAGITFLITVLLKLLIIDMRNTGSGARTISFIGVGLLVLIIGGYFAPLPPKKEKEL